MNNLFILGRRSGPDTALNYTASDPLNYITACRYLNNGAWTNPAGDPNETELLAKTSNHEIEMVCELGNFTNSSIPAASSSERNCVFFKAPVAGIFKIVRKQGVLSESSTEKFFLVFIPLENCLQINFQVGIFQQEVGVGNAIVIGLNNPVFDVRLGSAIVKKGWVDYILQEAEKRSPVAGPIIGRERVGRAWRDRVLFTREELMAVKRLAAESRLAEAWRLSSAKFTEELMNEFSFPINVDGILPLYSFNTAGELGSLRMTLGFAELPHTGQSYEYNSGWTWFDPVRMIRKLSFTPDWNITDIPSVAADQPIVAWHGHVPPAATEAALFRITKLVNQQCMYLNPTQIQYLNSLTTAQKRQKDNDASKRISFFLANRLHGTNLAALSSARWFQRSSNIRRDTLRNPPTEFTPVNGTSASENCSFILENTSRFLQIKASTEGTGAAHAHVITSKLVERDSDEMFNDFMALFGAATPETAALNTFSNGEEINTWFEEKTGHNYLDWINRSVLHTTIDNRNHFSDRHLLNNADAQRRFLEIWRNPSLIFSPTRAPVRINIFQLLALMTIMANESPSLEPQSGRGSMSYFFQRIIRTSTETIGTRSVTRVTRTKASYNLPARPGANNAAIPAGYLFFPSDPSAAPRGRQTLMQRYQRHHELFWREHAASDFTGADGFPSVTSVAKERWNGSVYPRNDASIEAININDLEAGSSASEETILSGQRIFDESTFLFPDLSDRVTIAAHSKILGEADFCKFRGRGLIQLTWRYNYVPLIELLQSESWVDPAITAIKNRWESVSHDPDEIATISRNSEWDTLFYDTHFEFACRAIYQYQSTTRRNSMLNALNNQVPIERLLERVRESGTIYNVGGRVGSSTEYYNKYYNRVKQQMKALIIDYRRTHPTT